MLSTIKCLFIQPQRIYLQLSKLILRFKRIMKNKFYRIILKYLILIFLVIFGVLATYFFWALIPGSIGVLQGATDDKSTQFTIVSDKSGLVCYVRESGSNIDPLPASATDEVKMEGSPFKIRKCYFDNLDATKKYELEIVDQQKNEIDKRSFGLLPIKDGSITLGIISCTSDLVHIPTIWESFFSHSPNMLLMIGDNVYADVYKEFTKMTDIHLWHRYTSTWRVLRLFRSEKLIPVLGIWDDHDYGVNNGNSSHRGKDFSKFLFETFFAQSYPNSRLKKGPANSFIYELGKTKLIFLDGRYFRSAPDNHIGSYFSLEQTQWVVDELNQNKDSVNWIINGNQWFGSPYQEENFEHEQPEGLKKFLEKLNQTGAKYILISGDTHFSEIKKVNYLNKKVFEITSSSMHSWPPGLIFPDDRRLVEPTNQPNYTLARFSEAQPEVIEFTAYGVLGNLKYTYKINLSEQ